MEKIFQEVVKIVSDGTGINGNDLIHSKKHSEVFNIAKNKVCELTGLDIEDIIKSNKECCVNARYALIGATCNLYTDYELSQLSSLSRQGINKIRNNVNLKKKYSYSFKLLFEDISQCIENY